MRRPDQDNRQRRRNATGDLTGYHFASQGVARTLPAGRTGGCEQNWQIWVAPLSWRQPKSARAYSAGRMWVVLRPCFPGFVVMWA
jgi:hypothetical protein